MTKIVAPNKINGLRASVQFTGGVAQTNDPHLIHWFKAHGYKVVNAKENDVDEMTLAELKSVAANSNIDLGRITKKEDIKQIVKKALFSENKTEGGEEYDDEQDYDDGDI